VIDIRLLRRFEEIRATALLAGHRPVRWLVSRDVAFSVPGRAVTREAAELSMVPDYVLGAATRLFDMPVLLDHTLPPRSIVADPPGDLALTNTPPRLR